MDIDYVHMENLTYDEAMEEASELNKQLSQ
jgi:hypothetical protein